MLEIVPMTLKEANAFVEQNHHHNPAFLVRQKDFNQFSQQGFKVGKRFIPCCLYPLASEHDQF